MKSAGSLANRSADRRFSSPSTPAFNPAESPKKIVLRRLRMKNRVNTRWPIAYLCLAFDAAEGPGSPIIDYSLLRYRLRSDSSSSLSPLSPMKNTPVKVEGQEDVLAMDAVSESMPRWKLRNLRAMGALRL